MIKRLLGIFSNKSSVEPQLNQTDHNYIHSKTAKAIENPLVKSLTEEQINAFIKAEINSRLNVKQNPMSEQSDGFHKDASRLVVLHQQASTFDLNY